MTNLERGLVHFACFWLAVAAALSLIAALDTKAPAFGFLLFSMLGLVPITGAFILWRALNK